MEFMLKAVIVVFMLFLCALCLFAVVVIARDMVHESALSKREREAAKNSEAKEPVQVVVQPVISAPAQSQPVVEEAPMPIEEEEVIPEAPVEEVAIAEEVVSDDGVKFSKVSLTMIQKYEMLSSEYKRYFDEIVKHALSKEGVVEAKRNAAFDYRDGAYRVLRMTIKRGEIICEFNFIERDFKNYASAASVKVKQLGTAVKVTERSAVGVVKDGIDLMVSQIAADREYKKELAKERRREKRRQERAAAKK
jgi:hypothetical protein